MSETEEDGVAQQHNDLPPRPYETPCISDLGHLTDVTQGGKKPRKADTLSAMGSR